MGHINGNNAVKVFIGLSGKATKTQPPVPLTIYQERPPCVCERESDRGRGGQNRRSQQ